MRDLAFQINSTWEGGGEDGTEIGHRLQETFRGYVGLFKELEVPEASDCKLVFVRYDVGGVACVNCHHCWMISI